MVANAPYSHYSDNSIVITPAIILIYPGGFTGQMVVFTGSRMYFSRNML